MVFVDTGAFLAKFLSHDQFHQDACASWKVLERKRDKIITSNFILDETFTLLARKSYHEFALEKARLIYASNVIHILRPTQETEINALLFFKKYADQKISYTDCISFQLMKEHHIKKVFTFDQHFYLAGFEMIPG
jgi:predicted nucleic acid-binding protein